MIIIVIYIYISLYIYIYKHVIHNTETRTQNTQNTRSHIENLSRGVPASSSDIRCIKSIISAMNSRFTPRINGARVLRRYFV